MGLALGMLAVRRGLSILVLERQRYPVDKACGEGVMPAGVRILEELGVRAKLTPEDASPFLGIRYLQEDGTVADGRFPRNQVGLAIRRVALSRAMAERARELGVRVEEGVAARAHEVRSDGVTVLCDAGERRGSVLVLADGLNSTLRGPTLPAVPAAGGRRYGVRRHYLCEAWSDRVEVYFAAGAEAYVSAAGRGRVGVTFLWTKTATDKEASFETLLARFPRLAERLAGAAFDSTARGAGPLLREVDAPPVAARRILLGDAAGYVDAITGEGLTLGLRTAAVLAECLPAAVHTGGAASALAPYVRAHRREFRSYAALTRSLLWIAERPWVRRAVIRTLARAPWALTQLLRWVA